MKLIDHSNALKIHEKCTCIIKKALIYLQKDAFICKILLTIIAKPNISNAWL